MMKQFSSGRTGFLLARTRPTFSDRDAKLIEQFVFNQWGVPWRLPRKVVQESLLITSAPYQIS
jgi:hypothetical protein